MNKNNKMNFFSQQMYESLVSLCVNDALPIEIKFQKTESIEKHQIPYEDAIDSYFDAGFNVNNYWFDESKYSFPISMIEELTIYASNAQSLFTIYPNIDKDFFISMPYSEHKSLVSHLVSKVFFSNGEREYLLDILFSKGLKIIQEKNESIEINWIENGEIDYIRLLFSTQKNFDFDFQYNFRNQMMDFTSILELIIRETKSEHSLNEEFAAQAKINNLNQILEVANSLIIFQEIGEHTEYSEHMEIATLSDPNDIFKI